VIYLYAYTNHRADLDNLRRMGALWEILNDAGIEAELLVNDYRAQLAGRELGLPAATTIETIMDIDAVAEHGDTVVIDSPEEAGERLGRYVEKFARVLRVVPGGGESRYGEAVVDPFAPETILYRRYPEIPKEDRTVLIYGDSDADKSLLALSESPAGRGWGLYWGHYFYVKYEDLLAERFDPIFESEEYPELIAASRRIVTAMPQTALEAAAAGAEVLWLKREDTEGLPAALGIPSISLEQAVSLSEVDERIAAAPALPPVDTGGWLKALGL
jgi:hypothetical protein